jgi:hypothetical protein
MSDVLDLRPIKARLAATTPGTWKWVDEVADIPYEEAWWQGGEPITPGNDGSLGVAGLYVEIPPDEYSDIRTPVFVADDEDIPEDPDDTDEVDWSKWRGLIHAKNLADLEFIAHAKTDVEALIAEVELLRSLIDS